MKKGNEISRQEEKYLKSTISFLEERLEIEHEQIHRQKEDIIAVRRDMYASTPSDSQDTDRASEAAQFLAPLTVQTMNYHATEQRIDLYQRMLTAPYFARIDFTTPRWGKEVIYIGLGNLEDEDTFDVYVYDWRAPISSLFYRFELGEASYKAPAGVIEGEVTLKRQFEIKNGELKFFFDSGVNIVDEILKQTLSQNSSPQMRTIVETIQREQDIIIRDVENDLVLVQGVAGSGKTSIALHRAAYLMYDGLSSRLSAKNMILISPNRLLEQYIAQVLPELGEENIRTVTFEDVFFSLFPWEEEPITVETRNLALEQILTAENQEEYATLHSYYTYKTTDSFLRILDWYAEYYLKEIAVFPDFVFGERVVAQGMRMKNRALMSQSKGFTVQTSLDQVRIFVKDIVDPTMRRQRLKELEKILGDKEEHYFDYKEAAREALAEEIIAFEEQLNQCVTIDYLEIYKTLMSDPTIVKKAAELEREFPSYAQQTLAYLERDTLPYVDSMALLYLKVRMDNVKPFQEIRQVVVDEAQDYSKIHFEIMRALFPSSKYTILADVNQTILDTETDTLYDMVQDTLEKKKNLKVSLNKSFRCSYEIATYSAHFADTGIEIETLERHEAAPVIVGKKTEKALHNQLVQVLKQWKDQEFGTIAVVCKNMETAKELYEALKDTITVDILEENSRVDLSNVIILPVYLAKGLEFDAVAVYGVDADTYYTDDHRRLLYIACTRALHRLGIFYKGQPSPLLPPVEAL